MSKNTTNTISLDQFKDKHFGKLGTASRQELEKGYQFFKKKCLETISNKQSTSTT
jgi:hypothetical protein